MSQFEQNQTPPETPLLVMECLTKTFGGNIACDSVSVAIKPGKILALLGENGAGKSTLIKMLAGIYPKDSGTFTFKGKEIVNASVLRNKDEQPIAFIHQDLGLVDWMTVGENMAFSMGFSGKLINWKKVNQRARQALQHVGVDIDPETRVFDLSQAEKALLAIARAIAVNAEVLVLDEPTASLSADDVKLLFKALRVLQEKGVGMIYVTHRLDEVMEICDEVVVMRDGQLVSSGNTSDYELHDLVDDIVGEKGAGEDQMRVPLPPDDAPSVLAVKDLIVGDTGPVELSVKRGEMVALVGLRGAGQEEIGRMLFGLRKKDSGEVLMHGKSINPKSPNEAIANGISLVARNRMNESLVAGMSVQENLFLNPLNNNHKLLSYYSRREENVKTEQAIKDFGVSPPQADIDIASLSGGNQQKVIMARWLGIQSPLLILEDPTAGVDIGARADIYRLLNESIQAGLSVLLISTDFEEIAKICNRAIVFNRGQVSGHLQNEAVNFSNILKLAQI